jgi:hypothetical protein
MQTSESGSEHYDPRRFSTCGLGLTIARINDDDRFLFHALEETILIAVPMFAKPTCLLQAASASEKRSSDRCKFHHSVIGSGSKCHTEEKNPRRTTSCMSECGAGLLRRHNLQSIQHLLHTASTIEGLSRRYLARPSAASIRSVDDLLRIQSKGRNTRLYNLKNCVRNVQPLRSIRDRTNLDAFS